MIPSFTIVPDDDFEYVAREILQKAERDTTILISRGDNISLYFAGDAQVAELSRSRGLACLRILGRRRVLHVETDAYERSAADLEIFLRWVVEQFPPLHIFDDETGADYANDELDEIGDLFVAEPEFLE